MTPLKHTTLPLALKEPRPAPDWIPNFIDLYDPRFASDVCSWIPNEQALHLVSGEIGPGLTRGLLDCWVERAECALVMLWRDAPIAFATLSRNEWRLPASTCEICHLVVAPGQRRQYHGSFFVNCLLRLAVHKGYDQVVGRVNPENEAALALMRYLRWREITGAEEWSGGPFRWFTGPARRWS
jgi:hypothetical protein